jgi:hypothetical protein
MNVEADPSANASAQYDLRPAATGFALRGPATSISRNTLRRPRAEASARLMFLSGEVSSKNSTTSQQGHCRE